MKYEAQRYQSSTDHVDNGTSAATVLGKVSSTAPTALTYCNVDLALTCISLHKQQCIDVRDCDRHNSHEHWKKLSI
jgi:hypothetical protein